VADSNIQLRTGEQIADQSGGATLSFAAKWLRALRAPQKYLVSGLPTNALKSDWAYATDLRVFNGTGTLEGAGSGTGGLVTFNGTNWVIAGTNVVASA
jgi:hypothetical protein